MSEDDVDAKIEAAMNLSGKAPLQALGDLAVEMERPQQEAPVTQSAFDKLFSVSADPCKRCGGTRYSVKEHRTRRSDEPSSYVQACSNCGKIQ